MTTDTIVVLTAAYAAGQLSTDEYAAALSSEADIPRRYYVVTTGDLEWLVEAASSGYAMQTAYPALYVSVRRASTEDIKRLGGVL